MSVFLTSVKLLTDSTWQSLHSWLVWLRKRISPSINQSANAVSESIDGTAGGKDTVRGRAASFASEGGQHRRPYIFIVYFSINWFHQNGYSASFWTGIFIKNSKQPNHQDGEIIYPNWGSASPKWNRLTAVENFLSPKWWFPVFSGKLGKLNYLLTRFTNKSSS